MSKYISNHQVTHFWIALSAGVCVCAREGKEVDKKEIDRSLIGTLLRKYLSTVTTTRGDLI